MLERYRFFGRKKGLLWGFNPSSKLRERERDDLDIFCKYILMQQNWFTFKSFIDMCFSRSWRVSQGSLCGLTGGWSHRQQGGGPTGGKAAVRPVAIWRCDWRNFIKFEGNLLILLKVLIFSVRTIHPFLIGLVVVFDSTYTKVLHNTRWWWWWWKLTFT
jgi:hypothetical protein